MKKLFLSTWIGLLSVFFFAHTASAADFFMKTKPIIPDPLVVINYEGAEDNPVKDFLTALFEKIDASDTLQEDLKTNRKVLFDLLDQFVLNNSMAVVVAQPDADFTYFEVAMSQDDYDALLEMLQQYEGFQTTTYQSTKIYTSYKREAFAFTYDAENSVVLMTKDADILKTILSTQTAPGSTLSYIYDQVPANAFLSVVVGHASPVTSEDDTSTMLKGFASVLEYSVIGLTQTKTDHFVITSYTEGDADSFTSADLDYTDFTFTPSLYKDLPGDNAFLYYEAQDLYDLVKKFFVASGEDTTAFNAYDALVGSLFNDRLGLLLQFDPDSLIPYFTLVLTVDPNDKSDTAAVIELNALLTAELQASDSADLTTSGDLTVMTADLSGEMDVPDEDAVKAIFTATYGMISTTEYILSTNPDIQTAFGNDATALTANSDFMDSLGTVLNTDNLLEVSYINFDVLGPYLETIKSLYGDTMEDPTAFDATTAFLETGIDPWYAYMIALNALSTEKISTIHVPVSDAINYLTDAIVSAAEQEITAKTESEFSDVSVDGTWYGEDVAELEAADVVKGSNGKFRPGDSITRAEFITMVLRHYDLEDTEAPLGSTIFSDVDASSWYDQDIGIAYSVGLIKGDAGSDTVRPDDLISRAEALQVLVNYSGVLYNASGEDMPFTDVSGDEWFSTAVEKGYAKGIVTGVDATHFEPARSLTRAEAAVLINRVSSEELTLGF